MRSHTQGFLRSAAAGYDASACDRSTTSAAKLKVSFLCNRVIATSNTAMASSAEYNIVELYTNNCWLVKAVSQECFPLSFAPLLSKLSTKQQMVLDFGRFNKIMSRKHKYVKLDDFAATADNSLATGSKRRPRPCVVNCTSSTMAVRDWTRACLFFFLYTACYNGLSRYNKWSWRKWKRWQTSIGKIPKLYTSWKGNYGIR